MAPQAAPLVQALQALPNAEFMLSFGKSGTVQQWDCSTMDYSYSGSLDTASDPSPPIATAASADGRLVASCAANSHTIVRDVASLAVVLEMSAVPGSRVKSVSFSGDCAIMAVVLFDSSVTLWHLQRQEVMWQPQARGMMDDVDGHSAGVNACFLSQVRRLQCPCDALPMRGSERPPVSRGAPLEARPRFHDLPLTPSAVDGRLLAALSVVPQSTPHAGDTAGAAGCANV